MSTASCSSPKEFTHAVPPQEAVLTLKDMVLNASPMHTINLINPLSGVAFVRNSSYIHKVINIIFIHALHKLCAHEIKLASLQLTKLSPISHLVTRVEFFAFETFNDDFGTTLNDSPKSELDFKLCHAYIYHTPF
jgi:hypothetical protein